MPRRSFTFNGVRKPWIHMTRGRTKPPFAPYRRNILTVPGMPGAYLQSSDIEPIFFEQPIAFKAMDDSQDLQLKDELAEWLLTDKPAPLEFDDEPGRTYYAVVQNTISDLEKISVLRQGKIHFLCLDPYAYGPEVPYQFNGDVGTIENKGTAEAKPIIEMEVKQPVTFAMIQNHMDEYILIGEPYDVDNHEPVPELTSIYDKRMDNFIGWTDLAAGHTWDGPLGGLVTGSFAVGNGQWYVNNFGTNPNGWHGPSKRTSFNQSLQDFQIDYFISQLNFTGELGKNVLFLMDEFDNVIACFGAVDKTVAAGYNNKVQFYLGRGQKLIYDYQGFNNTQMWLRLIRKGNLFTAIVYQVREDGTMYNKVTRTFEDRLGEYQAPIRQAAVYVAKFKDYRATRMYVNRLQANRINDLSANQIPYIANVGDIIRIDHVEKMIYINGEPRPDLKGFGGSFFPLVKGENQLYVLPSESFNISLTYRERYR